MIAILPMAFVGGLMGPHTPDHDGATAAMIWSLLIAFIVTPWAALRFLRHTGERVTAGTMATTGQRASIAA